MQILSDLGTWRRSLRIRGARFAPEDYHRYFM
jgi:hypothetical protein